MEFTRVLPVITTFLEGIGARFAVIGGVAMAAYGMLRTTIDLDFVVEAAAKAELLRFMESKGYETLRDGSGYSNHIAAMKAFAIKNDPSRAFQDLADIRYLLKLDGVDRVEIKSYLDRHGITERLDGSGPG